MNINSLDREIQNGKAEVFSNAIGDGLKGLKAKRSTIEGQHKICTRRCKAKHPFSRTKLTSCKNACNNTRTTSLNAAIATEASATGVSAKAIEQELMEGSTVANLSESDINTDNQASAGISLKTVLIGFGVLTVIGTVIYFARKARN